MRVVLDNGTSIELGDVEATPTIGITDFSRRVTDDFGITTVVERPFKRLMSVKLALPFDSASAVQQQLAGLRATSALWIADDRFAWLSARGFYKAFDIDHASPPLSYCTLTVEGLAETSVAPDDGTDPAPIGTASTLRLLQPSDIDDQALSSSSVPENDYPEWAAATTYPLAARVIKAGTHRVYESVAAANAGNDPAGVSGKWLDVGPTNRWAMFDQALGSLTSAANSITVALNVAGINAVALLDVIGAQVRVQATGYDSTMPAIAGAITFLGLPETAKRVTVTVTGSGQVSAGTLMIGRLLSLGITEASPTAGITDYSRKDVDDFGDVTVVPRAWAKRMTAKALIRTDAIDAIANRIAAVRARPSLWIGQAGIDSLTVYGFFKDFSIEVGVNVSTLSLSIEGLSEAAPIVPAAPGSVAWPDVTDPDGTKPSNNADVTGDHTSKDTNAIGGKPAADFLAELAAAQAYQDNLNDNIIPSINAAAEQAGVRIDAARVVADKALSDAGKVNERVDSLIAEGGGGSDGVDTVARSEIKRVEKVVVDGDTAAAQRLDSVEAQTETVDDRIDAKAKEITTAFTDADNAFAERARLLEAQASPSGGNLVPNSSLSTRDGWRLTANRDQAGAVGTNQPGSDFQLGGVENNLTLYRASAGTGSSGSGEPEIEVQSPPFAVRPDSTLQFYALTSSHRSKAWTALFFFDGDDRFIGTSGSDSFGARINLGGQNLNAWDITGRPTVVVPINATKARFVVRQYDVSNDGYYWMTRPFVTEVKPGTNTWVPYSPGNDRPVTGATSARVSEIDSVIADLPNRYAAASRTAALEAQVNFAADSGLLRTVSARIEDRATAIADSKAGAVAQTLSQLRAEYNGTAATVSQQAGAIAGIDGRTSVFWQITGTTPDGSTRISLSKSNGSAGVFYIGANLVVDGDAIFNGSVTARKFDRTSMSREGSSSYSGSVTPDPGQTVGVPWSLSLTQIPPVGRFIYEFSIGVTTNAGQRVTTTLNGRPAYTDYIADGGARVVATDGQGNIYAPSPNSSQAVLATTDFVPSWSATVTRGNVATGYADQGDYYIRQVSATYTLTLINLKVTWVAI